MKYKEIKPSIMVVVKQKEKNKTDYNRCLNAEICPECGEPLTVITKQHITKRNEYNTFLRLGRLCAFNNIYKIYKCAQCKFIHETGKEV